MPTNDDEPTPLDSRISVLGISYEGLRALCLDKGLFSRRTVRR